MYNILMHNKLLWLWNGHKCKKEVIVLWFKASAVHKAHFQLQEKDSHASL